MNCFLWVFNARIDSLGSNSYESSCFFFGCHALVRFRDLLGANDQFISLHVSIREHRMEN
jgi:hypothetical protein